MSSRRPSSIPATLPGPVRWLLWLVAAALASVLLGFFLGLARPRPREAAPW